MPKRVWVNPCKVNGKHTGIYNTWRQMLSRCLDPKSKSYKDYGARGVTVCEEWLSYDAFYEWAMVNGWKAGLTIDRIQNGLGYSPANCRWITRSIQNQNKRNVKTYNGKRIAELAESYGLSYATVYYRLKHGISLEAPLMLSKSHKGGAKK